MNRRISVCSPVLLLLWLCTACSVTEHLPASEKLYIGISEMRMEGQPSDNPTGTVAMEEVEAALAYPPNGAILGSSTLRSPFPFRLWIYNHFRKYQRSKGLGHWILRHLGTEPVYLSTVNAPTRVKVASNLMHDYGFFSGKVTYSEVPHRNPRMARLSYLLDWGAPTYIDTLSYLKFPAAADSLIRKELPGSLVHPGDQFNVVTLDEERNRISTLLRNQGYFYFAPSFLTYRADTLRHPGYAELQLLPVKGVPANALHPWFIGDVTVHLTGAQGQQPDTLLRTPHITFRYHGQKPGIRPGVIRRHLLLEKGQAYSQARQTLSQELLARLGVFQYTEFRFEPRDTTALCDTLDLHIHARFDKPYDVSLELNATRQSTGQLGPGVTFTLARNNLLRTASRLTWEVYGSYQWQTRRMAGQGSSVMNSYEIGTSVAIDCPRIVLPWSDRSLRRARYPQDTQLRLNAEQLHRASFFSMLSFGGSLTYSFRRVRTMRHSITPLSLTYTMLQETTARFDSVMDAYPRLAASMGNRFIPAMSYTFTFDNSSRKADPSVWWETTFKSAGNLTSLLYALCGESLNRTDKTLMGNAYAQFLKLTSEVRLLKDLGHRRSVAVRVGGGIIWSYGNGEVAPYAEQFYVGGANSVRAFTVRSVGPGTRRPVDARYGYVDGTGDVKFEANAEYRFPLVADLYGALFLDAGNVWTLRDTDQPGSRLPAPRDFTRSLALGTGCGLRYDLSFLVLRLDAGIALHAPYDTGRSGYYNIPRFRDGLGIHLAVGYPF